MTKRSKLTKVLGALTLTLLLALGSVFPTLAAAPTVPITLESGKTIDGILLDSVTYIPLRRFCDAMGGAQITWNAKTNTATATDSEETFVLNTSSKKYHRETCSGVSTMSPQNRQDYTGDREDLEEQGYEPCGICKP